MRVSLVNVKANYDCMEPLGVLYLGTVLKKAGHDVQVREVFPNNEERAIRDIKSFNPDLVGFTILTPSYAISSALIKNLQKQVKAYYCAGGPHITTIPVKSMDDLKLDFVVIGEGEYTLKEIADGFDKNKELDLKDVKGVVYKKNKKAINNGFRELIQDLDELPIIDRNLLLNYPWYLSPPGTVRGKVYKGFARMMASRGCPYNCIFCGSNSIFGRKVRRRSVDNVMLEINDLIKKFGVKGVYFVDDTFTLDPKWVIRFCDKLIESNVKLIWACQARVNTIREDVLRKMKKAGCVQLDIGVESGSDRILKNLKKGINVEMTRKAFKIIKTVGMRTEASFIIGSPGETMEDIRKTEELIEEINPSITMCNIMTPHPGSEIYDMAKKNHWFMDSNINFSEKWLTMKASDDPIMKINIDPKELVKIRSRFENKHFFKDHIVYFFGFFKYPGYLLKLAYSIIKNSKGIFKETIIAIKRKKIRLVPEFIYQKFNEDLVHKWI